MEFDSFYTIIEVCEIFDISKGTVYKWIHGNDVEKPVIPRDGWIRLPRSGQIRIKGEIIRRFHDGDFSLKGQLSIGPRSLILDRLRGSPDRELRDICKNAWDRLITECRGPCPVSWAFHQAGRK